jgi:hypothetical protein
MKKKVCVIRVHCVVFCAVNSGLRLDRESLSIDPILPYEYSLGRFESLGIADLTLGET